MRAPSFPATVAPAIAARTPGPLSALWTLTGYFLSKTVRSVLIWGFSLGALAVMVVAVYPSIGAQISDLLKSYPPELRALFGAGSQVSTVQSWLGVELFNFLAPLTLAFYPILIGARAIAGAEEKGSLDVLLSNPVPRWQLVASTFLTMAVGLLCILAILAALTWAPSLVVDVNLPLSSVLAGVLNLWPLCMWFGALALLCSALVRRTALAMAIPGGLLVLMYFVNGLGGMTDVLDPLRPATLFYHYGSAIEHGIRWTSFAVISLFALAFACLAIAAFNRRDLYT
ncbi:MAG: ABC transporter permease [Chloroflexota bacterium]|nr:ABC transporter permease [Chloroflexota bacterium]